MRTNIAPIILFVYNRFDHTRQTVEALKKNELASESILYVFADGLKDNATSEQASKVAEVISVERRCQLCENEFVLEHM